MIEMDSIFKDMTLMVKIKMGITLEDMTKMGITLEDKTNLGIEKMDLINKVSTERVLIEMGLINF